MNKLLFLTLIVLTSINAMASNKNDLNELTQVKEHAVRVLKNTPVDSVNKTPIDGLYELRAKANIFYFAPKSEYFFFGEMFNKEGKSITRIKKESALREFLANNKEKAILIGDPNATNVIYEFTDPLCPFCLKYESFIQKKEDVKRYVFFYYPAHPQSKAKVVHILCSDDKAKAMESIFKNEVADADLVTCKEGIALQEEHLGIANQIGARGTPTLFVNNTKIGGFSPTAINKVFVSKVSKKAPETKADLRTKVKTVTKN